MNIWLRFMTVVVAVWVRPVVRWCAIATLVAAIVIIWIQWPSIVQEIQLAMDIGSRRTSIARW